MSGRVSKKLPGAPIKVAVVITGLEIGGAETFLGELLRKKPDDIEMRVYSLIDGGPIAEKIASLGIPVVGLHMQCGPAKPALASEPGDASCAGIGPTSCTRGCTTPTSSAESLRSWRVYRTSSGTSTTAISPRTGCDG